jgi:hypothetical protein
MVWGKYFLAENVGEIFVILSQSAAILELK